MNKIRQQMAKEAEAFIPTVRETYRIARAICAFDCIVHQLHLRAGNKGVTDETVCLDNLSPWSREVRDFLDERRKT